MCSNRSAIEGLFLEGKEMLAIQRDKEASVERRIAELLRFCVASIGGVVVVSGLLLTARVEVTGSELVALGSGILGMVVSAFILARMVVGRDRDAGFAYGPNIRAMLPELRERTMTNGQLVDSMLEVIPDWMDENDAILARQRAGKLAALMWLAGGATLVLLALIYIVGGHFLG